MENKMYCFYCKKEVEVIKKEEINEYTVRDKTLKIKEDAYYCANCKAMLIDEVLDKDLTRIYNAYLGLYGLNLGSFKEIRNDLNLSQELFAKVLGWSKKSIVRYETMEELPQGEYLKTYVKLNKNKDKILEYLDLNRGNMDILDIKRIMARLNLKIDIKSRNVIRYMLKDNPLFILPLIKNLFAVDFLSVKETYRPLTNFKYVKMQMGPVIDGYKDIINVMLLSGEIKLGEQILVGDDIKFKYETALECDLFLFTDDEIKLMDKVKRKLRGMSAKDLSLWSHTFKGWIETDDYKIIDFKYAEFFQL